MKTRWLICAIRTLGIALIVGATGFVSAATVDAIASGDLTTATPFGSIPTSGNDYVINNSTYTIGNPDGDYSFPGDSLTVQAGTLSVQNDTNFVTRDYSYPNLTLAGGELRFLYNGAASYSTTMNLNTGIDFAASTTSTIEVYPTNGGNANKNAHLNGALTGSGDVNVHLAVSGGANLNVNVANSTYSGDWTVTADAFTQIFVAQKGVFANAANALGTGTVTLGNRGTLWSTVDGALNSLAGITLNGPSSDLWLASVPADYDSSWTNTSAFLDVNQGTVTIGSKGASIGNLSGTGGAIRAVRSSTASLTVNQTTDATYAGEFVRLGSALPPNPQIALSLIKNGAATLNLTGDSTGSTGTTGTFTVAEGTLLINGAIQGNTTVLSDATLGGDGTINANVTVNDDGTLAPGSNATGVLDIGGNLDIDGNYAVEVDGTSRGTGYDSVNVLGASRTVDLAGSTLQLDFGSTPADGNYWLIVNDDDTSSVSGMFTDWVEGQWYSLAAFGGGSKMGRIFYGANFATNALTGGNDVLMQVPEPASITLLALGLGGAFLARRRRRATAIR